MKTEDLTKEKPNAQPISFESYFMSQTIDSKWIIEHRAPKSMKL